MATTNKILTVFEKYGFGLFKSYRSQQRVTDTEKTLDYDYFRKFLQTMERYEFSRQNALNHLEALNLFYVLDSAYCRIVDLEKWKNTFNVDPNKLSFPIDFIPSQHFILLSPEYPELSFVLSNTNSSDIASTLRFPVDIVREAFDPSFRFLSIFHPKDAREKADLYILDCVEQFDNIHQSPVMRQLASELLDVTLDELNLNKNDLLKIIEHHKNTQMEKA